MTFLPSLRPTLLGALLGLQALAHAAPAAPAEVRFDTTPRAGMHQRQTIDMRARMTMRMEATADATEEQRAKVAQAAQRMGEAGEIKMLMQMQQTTAVGQPDAEGWLPLNMTMGHRKMTVEVGGKAMPVPADRQADLRVKARFEPKDFRFEVQEVEGGPPGVGAMMTSQGASMLNDAFKLHKALAAQSMKIGESVEVPLTMALPMPLPGGAGGLQGQVKYTLKRVERGVAYFDLGMTMNIKIDTPLPASAAAAASAASAPEAAASAPEAAPRVLHMVMNGSGKGTSALRLADQLPVDTQLVMDLQMTVDGPDNSRMQMDMVMDTRSKGESLSGKAATPAKKKS